MGPPDVRSSFPIPVRNTHTSFEYLHYISYPCEAHIYIFNCNLFRGLVAFQNARVCSQKLVNDLTLATTFPSIMNETQLAKVLALPQKQACHDNANDTLQPISEFQVQLPFIVILTYPNESVMGK